MAESIPWRRSSMAEIIHGGDHAASVSTRASSRRRRRRARAQSGPLRAPSQSRTYQRGVSSAEMRLGLKGLIGRLHRRRLNHRAVQEFSRSLALIVDREALEASVAARIRELF